MMNKNIALASALLLSAGWSVAEDSTVLTDVVVQGQQNEAINKPNIRPWSHSQVSKQGIDILGGPAQTNPERLLELMPSVNTESVDAYGLSGSRNINIRGKGSFHLTRNIENLPLAGIVGAGDLIDLDNIDQFELYRSAIPANVSLGVSHTTGVMNMNFRRSAETFGLEFKQGFGSDAFQRTFVRMDSGKVGPAATSFFVSASDGSADKWRGAGKSGDRQNVTFGLSQPFANGALFEVFALKTNTSSHNYRTMTYAQIQDKANWGLDGYDSELSANPAKRSNYYDFNRAEKEDKAVIAELSLPLTATSKLTIKPYWWDNEGYTLSANGNKVRRWDIVHGSKGITVEYDLNLSEAVEVTAGYWAMNMESPPPPVYQKNYLPQADGSLVFDSWALLSKHSDHQFRSPYLQLTGQYEALTLAAGVRYHQQRQPTYSYYATAGLPDVAYDDIWDYSPVADPNVQVKAKQFNRLLPNLSLLYQLDPTLSFSAAYGRRLGRADWGPVVSTYIGNQSKFAASNVSLQDVFDNLGPELSDNVDLGLRYEGDRLYLAPNLYYVKSHDKEVSMYNPSVDVSYYQSVAKATGYGAELEGNYWVVENLSTVFALSYNRYAFDADIQSKAGVVTAAKGKQVPNTAYVLAKMGLNWQNDHWHASAINRYVGKRYGDILNTETVDSYWLTDLHLSYGWKRVLGLQEASVGASVVNLFDKAYIGQIAANDFNLNAGASYSAGAPRVVALDVTAKF